MKIIRNMEGILEVMRAKRDKLNISHETIDSISGVQSGYTSKILSPVPLKGVGYQSLGDLLGALAIGFIPVDDPEQRQRVEGRWQERNLAKVRKRSPRDEPQLASAASISEKMRALGQLTPREARVKGGKRRMRSLKKRARQAMASHAARIRWEKHRKS